MADEKKAYEFVTKEQLAEEMARFRHHWEIENFEQARWNYFILENAAQRLLDERDAALEVASWSLRAPIDDNETPSEAAKKAVRRILEKSHA